MSDSRAGCEHPQDEQQLNSSHSPLISNSAAISEPVLTQPHSPVSPTAPQPKTNASVPDGFETHARSATSHPRDAAFCAICRRPLPFGAGSDGAASLAVANIRPRNLRLLLKDNPHSPLAAFYGVSNVDPLSAGSRRICTEHINATLRTRLEFLLEEDLSQYSRLQEDAIKNLQRYEIEEQNWLDRFDLSLTLSDRAADTLARVAGSWGFVIGVLTFIASWATINLIMSAAKLTPFDEYPFILLNLMLSTIAAVQGPVIMMSQNRQADRDRMQNNYVSEAILRNEHQTRLVDGKVDHLLSYRWKGLLEIQEIQIRMLELIQQQSSMLSTMNAFGQGSLHADHNNANAVLGTLPRSHMQHNRHAFPPTRLMSEMSVLNPMLQNQSFINMPASPIGINTAMNSQQQYMHHRAHKPQRRVWNVEIQPDALTRMLLRHYFDAALPGDTFVFAHWHEDGDNFTAEISDVAIDIAGRHLAQITFSLMFPDNTATMDDVFTGEGTVSLRNDFSIAHMHHNGRISRVDVQYNNGAVASFSNGKLPPRYKPAFARRRQERITEPWKTHATAIRIAYVPPLQVAVIDVPVGHALRGITVTVYPRGSGTVPNTAVYVAEERHPEDLSPIENQNNAPKDGAQPPSVLDAPAETTDLNRSVDNTDKSAAQPSTSNNQQNNPTSNPSSNTDHVNDIDKRMDYPLVYAWQVVGPRPFSTNTWRQIVDFVWTPPDLRAGANWAPGINNRNLSQQQSQARAASPSGQHDVSGGVDSSASRSRPSLMHGVRRFRKKDSFSGFLDAGQSDHDGKGLLLPTNAPVASGSTPRLSTSGTSRVMVTFGLGKARPPSTTSQSAATKASSPSTAPVVPVHILSPLSIVSNVSQASSSTAIPSSSSQSGLSHAKSHHADPAQSYVAAVIRAETESEPSSLVDDVRLETVLATTAAPVTIDVDQVFYGPATFVFLTDDARVGLHGEVCECDLNGIIV